MIILLLIFNFTSISISDSPNAGTCSNQNYLITSMQQSMMHPTAVPQPVQSGANNNKTIASNSQPVYDYNKYFFVK